MIHGTIDRLSLPQLTGGLPCQFVTFCILLDVASCTIYMYMPCPGDYLKTRRFYLPTYCPNTTTWYKQTHIYLPCIFGPMRCLPIVVDLLSLRCFCKLIWRFLSCMMLSNLYRQISTPMSYPVTIVFIDHNYESLLLDGESIYRARIVLRTSRKGATVCLPRWAGDCRSSGPSGWGLPGSCGHQRP